MKLALVLIVIGLATGGNRYQDVLGRLDKSRAVARQKVKTDYGAISSVLHKTLTDSIFPAWYGTPWDFNGISNEPGEGEIACGYFVSTTLKHVGFRLNRYKLAQQAASVIVKETCGKTYMHTEHNLDDAIAYLKKKSDGLYIVGIDFHVGFLSVEKNEVYFIHSDFYHNKVVRELAEDSYSLNDASIYVIGAVTNNFGLMAKWVNNKNIYGL